MRKEAFTDYYEILEISPNAQPETIQRVYRLLAQHYHPDNQETGDVARFNEVLEAYRVLSDPERRVAYDIEHRMVAGQRWKIFDQSSGVQGVEAERRKRMGILTLLYMKRINDSNSPSLNLFELENLLGCPREHLELSLWYLRESGRIARTDNGRYMMTAKGLEMLEEQASDSSHPRMRLLKPAYQEAAS